MIGIFCAVHRSHGHCRVFAAVIGLIQCSLFAVLLLHGALFASYTLLALTTCNWLKRRGLRAGAVLIWSTAFVFAFLYLVGFGAITSFLIPGLFTSPLLLFVFRSPVPACCCALATGIAMAMFIQLAPEGPRYLWPPVAWHAVTAAGLAFMLWFKRPRHNS